MPHTIHDVEYELRTIEPLLQLYAPDGGIPETTDKGLVQDLYHGLANRRMSLQVERQELRKQAIDEEVQQANLDFALEVDEIYRRYGWPTPDLVEVRVNQLILDKMESTE